MITEIPNEFEFVIIGGGTAGALAFYYLSQFAPEKTLLIEKKPKDLRYHSAKIIVGHAKQYLHGNLSLRANPKEDGDDIFLRDIDSICNSSRNAEGPMFGKEEFGKPYGKVIDEQNFIRWHIRKAANNGAQVLWGTEVLDINESDTFSKRVKIIQRNEENGEKGDQKEKMKKVSGKDVELKTNLVFLATGSHDESLLRSLGFPIPYSLNQIVATFYADPHFIDSCYKTDYFYHLHPRMSTRGPLQMTKGSDFFNMILVSEESHEKMVEKFMRIIKKYDYVQPLFQEVKNPPSSFDPATIIRKKVWKDPISRFYDDHIILLGETTGLVTECYYEGLLGCFLTSRVATDLVKSLYKNQKSYSAKNLQDYDHKIRKELLQNFHISQKASEDMFLGQRDDQFKIWDAYIKAINKDKRVRRNIWIAWQDTKIKDYNLKNDEYCGERIYFSLPMITRMKLTPLFLKMKFSD